MVPFALPASLYALLWLPFVGPIVTHLASHEIMHRLEHHGTAGVLAFVFIKPLIIAVGIVALALGLWWEAGDALVLLLAWGKLFGGDH